MQLKLLQILMTTSHSKYFTWSVASLKSEGKLVSFLKEQLGPEYSSRAIKRALESNFCRVNGRIERFASKNLVRGDFVELAKDWEQRTQLAKPKQTEILYEDDFFLIINKPAGIPSDTSLLKQSKSHRSLVLVHRLDRDTTGVLILSKSKSVKEKMVSVFREQKVEKVYLALVDKKMRQSHGKVENFLAPKKRFEGQTLYGSTFSKEGKYACTFWQCLGTASDYSLLECRPTTGRTRQIRVHLAEIGHPILGDAQYCRSFVSSMICNRHLLHAWKITFEHPMTQKKLYIEAPIPSPFSELMD